RRHLGDAAELEAADARPETPRADTGRSDDERAGRISDARQELTQSERRGFLDAAGRQADGETLVPAGDGIRRADADVETAVRERGHSSSRITAIRFISSSS